MEAIIFKYLDKKYITDCSSVGNYGIYLKHDVPEHFRSPYNGSKLCKEVAAVFGFDTDSAKIFINSWALNVKKVNSLEFYWSFHSNQYYDMDTYNDAFPIANRIAASTIGLDLVSVQPMGAPTGKLLYFDHVVSVDPALETNEPVISRIPVNYELDKGYVDSQNVDINLDIQERWRNLRNNNGFVF